MTSLNKFEYLRFLGCRIRFLGCQTRELIIRQHKKRKRIQLNINSNKTKFGYSIPQESFVLLSVVRKFMDTKKNDRNKDVTEDDLNEIFENFGKLETSFIEEAKLYMSFGHLHTMDLYISAILNRAISLQKGFKTLAKENNYISAVPLIRIQLDNCLRLFAATLVTDYDNFFIEYLKGTHIRNLKDRDGKSMTDSYLAKKIDKEIFPGIYNLYVNASGYVHLSNEHSFLQTDIISHKERTLRTKVGYMDFFKIDQKVDYAYNMYKASDFLLKLAKSWKHQKKKIEDELNA